MPADLLARHLAASLRHPGSSFASFSFFPQRKSTGTQKHSRKTNNEKVVVKPYLPLLKSNHTLAELIKQEVMSPETKILKQKLL